jgi:predicted DNA-binding transcriptional regulator AlpA
MGEAMAWTQAEIDALKTAIAKGEKQVTFADRSVTYRSLDEMLTALQLMEAEVAADAGTSRPRQYGVVSRKAL